MGVTLTLLHFSNSNYIVLQRFLNVNAMGSSSCEGLFIAKYIK